MKTLKELTNHEEIWKEIDNIGTKVMALRQLESFTAHWTGGSIEEDNREVFSENVQKAKEKLAEASEALAYASHHIAMDMADQINKNISKKLDKHLSEDIQKLH